MFPPCGTEVELSTVHDSGEDSVELSELSYDLTLITCSDPSSYVVVIQSYLYGVSVSIK